MTNSPSQYTLDQVKEHNHEKSIWVAYDGNVYDITEFIEDHPGGADIIQEWAGKDISDVFRNDHSHSDYARDLLSNYMIGRLVNTPDKTATHSSHKIIKQVTTPTDKTNKQTVNAIDEIQSVQIEKRDPDFIDFNKPLFYQVLTSNWTKEYYLEQIHIPRYHKESPRFFQNSFLNMFSVNVWWGVPLFWCPIVIACSHYGLSELSFAMFMSYFVIGLFSWSVLEYVFHRFLFHVEALLPPHQLAFTLHFTIHGIHHLLPMDKYRLVMPPALMIILSIPVIWTLQNAFDVPTVCSLIAGGYTGYIAYDLMHYYFHHGVMFTEHLQRMKTYHMDHHYVDPNLGFGVSQKFWDVVFGTQLPTPPIKARKESISVK